MKHNTTNEPQCHWDDMWNLFEKVIALPRNQQAKTIASLGIENEGMKNELQQLIQAHYSQSTILDAEPCWQTEFDQAFQPPGVINGYQIERKLGSGGIGEVYLAQKKHNGFTRKVAIKFATIGRFSKHVLSSFNTELKVLLSLNHTNIERLYDGGVTEDNIPFLIVEYIDGTHIDKYCDQKGLTVNQRLMIFQKICQAVDAVHRSLIVHRDIKAANIMVGKDGEPKLVDFGLAKLTGNNTQAPDQTTLSNFMMTLAYASPEQIDNMTDATGITTASDIYSLGILLHRLLAGKLPYHIESQNLSATIKIIHEKIPKLASNNINKKSIIAQIEGNLHKKLSGELEQIIAKSIAKEPERRYLSAIQFSHDIQNYLQNKPVLAKKDSIWYRCSKFIQRHVIGITLGSTALISLLVLSVILFIQSNDLKQSLLDINQEQQRVLQVTNFLKDIFTISDPLVTDKKIVKVKELLDYSGQQLDAQFNDEPITKAKLYATLGNVYLNMSELSQAQDLFDKAHRLYQSNGYPSGVFDMQMAKIKLLQQHGEFNKAETQISLALSSYDVLSMSVDKQAEIEVLNGQIKYSLGSYEQALKLFESALKKRLTLFGEEHQLVVDTYQLLGNLYWRLGAFDKVKYYYQKGFDINTRVLGENNHKTLMSRSSLGILAYSQGDYDEALTHFKHVADARFKKLGRQHIFTAEAYNRLGAVYYEVASYEQARKKLTVAKDTYENLAMHESLKYARTLNNLGLVERQRKQYVKASETFSHAKSIELKLLGPDHIDVASLNNNLGMVAADMGDISKALDLFKKAYTVIHNNGEDNVNVAFSMTNIGRMYVQLNELNLAKEWIDKALNMRREKLGVDNLYYVETLAAKVDLDIKLNNINDLSRNIEHVINVRQRQLPVDDWRVAESKSIYALLNYHLDNEYYAQMYWCSHKLLQEKLGESHYRVKMLRDRQHYFNVQVLPQKELSCRQVIDLNNAVRNKT